MKDKQNVLVISLSNLRRDPRVYRQLFFLSNRDDLVLYAVGLSSPEISGIEFIEIPVYRRNYFQKALNAVRLKLMLFEQYYWSLDQIRFAFKKLKGISIDLIIANDLDTLPLAVYLSRLNDCKVYLDAHEYSPKQFEDRWSFRFFFQKYWDYIAKRYLPEVDFMTTVCDSISKKYETVYGVPSQVITNAPFHSALQPQEVGSNLFKMIHHGAASSSRQLENMIFLMDFLDDRFYLDFMLVPSQAKYFLKLQELAKGNPRIKFRVPVSMLDIPKVINQYDIGLYLLAPLSFNCEMALPNKLFEFIQGRVAVATWPSIEMKAVVEQYSCGIVSQEFTLESIAESLNQLTSAQIQSLKENANIAASELCAERNFERMSQILSSLLN